VQWAFKKIKQILGHWLMAVSFFRPCQRENEVVKALYSVRSSVATEAWRQTGEIWKAFNLRIVLAKLCWNGYGGKHHCIKSKHV